MRRQRYEEAHGDWLSKLKTTEQNFLPKLTEYIRQGKESLFYHWAIWKRAKRSALERDNYECQICKAFGNYSPATCVHHIQELVTHPWLALLLSNLMSLCDYHHNAVHWRLVEQINERNKEYVNEERW